VVSAAPSTRLALGTRRGRPEEVTPPALGFRSDDACCQRSSFAERQPLSPLLSAREAGGSGVARGAPPVPLAPLAVDPRRGSPALVRSWPSAAAGPGRSKPTLSCSRTSAACADSASGA